MTKRDELIAALEVVLSEGLRLTTLREFMEERNRNKNQYFNFVADTIHRELGAGRYIIFRDLIHLRGRAEKPNYIYSDNDVNRLIVRCADDIIKNRPSLSALKAEQDNG